MVMQGFSSKKCCVLVVCLVLVMVAVGSAAPSPYNDYENVRDLYELLLQKEAIEQQQQQQDQQHIVVRKANRSPSLRLRFGRRSDPALLPGSGAPF